MRDKKKRSLHALDVSNFFMADVQAGLGPYLAVYLSLKHWDPARIGVAMAAMSFADMAIQAPVGALVDSLRKKRLFLGLAVGAIGLSAITMVNFPYFSVIVALQALMGCAASFFPPLGASISLGLVGHRMLPRRLGRNEAFNHGGNIAIAVLAAFIGDRIAYEGIFYLVAAVSLVTVICLARIDPEEIDYARSRGAPRDMRKISRYRAIVGDGRVQRLLVAAFLFHLANAAMLPLLGQKIAAHHPGAASSGLSAGIIAAQLAMVPTVLLASRWAPVWGRRPVFVLGYLFLPLRGYLYTLTTGYYELVSIQLLDGIGAGIFGVISMTMVGDLTRGTGRFSFLAGVMVTTVGIGATASNLLAGYLVRTGGYDSAFRVLSLLALAAFVFCAVAIPETRQDEMSRVAA